MAQHAVNMNGLPPNAGLYVRLIISFGREKPCCEAECEFNEGCPAVHVSFSCPVRVRGAYLPVRHAAQDAGRCSNAYLVVAESREKCISNPFAMLNKTQEDVQTFASWSLSRDSATGPGVKADATRADLGCFRRRHVQN